MDNKKLMEQLRKIVREVIQEELKHGKSAYDSKTNISATELKDKEGKTVGYIKHTRDDRGGLVAAGRIGPKAAKAVTGDSKDAKKPVKESSDDEKGKEKPKEEPKKDKPMTVIKPEEMTPYQQAVAAYYASKGPGEYTGD